MGARHYDTVRPNYEALKEDLKKYGLTASQLGVSMGKSGNYIPTMFKSEKADRSTIEAVEDRMFRERGSYYTEIEKPVEKPTEPQEAKLSEGMGILLKQIVGAVNALSAKVDAIRIEPNTDKVIFRIDGFKAGNDRKMDELIKAVKESNAANEVILQDILQKQKEMTTLAARILSAMERRQG